MLLEATARLDRHDAIYDFTCSSAGFLEETQFEWYCQDTVFRSLECLVSTSWFFQKPNLVKNNGTGVTVTLEAPRTGQSA